MKETKIALITGGNKGLGLEVARQLAAKGFLVFLTARNRELGNRAAEDLAKNGVTVSFVELDVSKPESIRRAAEEVAAQIDHLDVLVNNAAILEGEHTSILRVSFELMQQTLQTNTIGPLLVAQAFHPLFRKIIAW